MSPTRTWLETLLLVCWSSTEAVPEASAVLNEVPQTWA